MDVHRLEGVSVGMQAAAKEKAAAEEAKKAEETQSLGERISALFDLPGLSALRGPLEPVLEIIEDNEYAAYGVVAFFVATPILFYLVAPKASLLKEPPKPSSRLVCHFSGQFQPAFLGC